MDKEDLEKLRENFSEDFDDFEIMENEVEEIPKNYTRRIKKPYVAS